MRWACGLVALVVLASPGSIWAQAPAGTIEVTADGCKLYLPQGDARGASRIRWSGKCTDGFAEGRGVVRIYSGGKISRVSETTFAAGKIASPGESYSIRGGEVIRSRGGDQLKIAVSELPTWALELSMLVDDRPRAPSRPAAPPPVAKAEKAAEQQKAEAERQAEAKRQQAEAQRQQAEAQKRQAEAKVAAEKLAAERVAQEADRKRLQAERDRAIAQAKAAQERAAAAEKLAAEKLAAERAAQDAERRRLQAEREQAMAEARAAAEAKAAADKLAAAKSAQEAEQKRQQAEKERVLAEAKAAADKAAAEAKAAEAKAAADAKAAAEKPRLPGAPGRGFADGGAGVPLRAVVTFKLTTPEGRDLGMATFVAGKGEAEIRQNAAALASVYEKVSPFKARLLDQPEVAHSCSGPGYVVEARVTYPSVKSYGWYAGCMGEDLDKAAKSMQELEGQMHRDYKVSPTSFWAYQYLIVGYVDEQNFRGRSDYEGLARPNMMAPGRVMVLSKPEQWAECNDLVNKDPKLKDKGACLREAVGKLKSQLGLR